MSANGNWPLVPLSELAKPVKRTILVEPGKSFRTLGVKLWGNGAYERQTIEGSQTAAITLNEVREDDLIINKIWVRNGSVAIVPSEVSGCCGSNEFPTFILNLDKVLPRWMHWYTKTKDLWGKCDALSQGSSGKNRIRPERFLTVTIPLPPLEEQRRIVARVDSLVAKIDEAKTLRKQSTSQLNAVAVSLAHRGDLTDDEKLRMGWKAIRLGDFIRTEYDDHKVQTCEEYPNLGIYSYGRGLFVKPPISGMATSAAKLRKVHSGQFIYSRLFAWEGAFGLVTPEFDGWYVSGEYPTFACDQHHILPEFLFAYFKTEQAWKKVAIGSKGLGSRRQRVQPEQILNHCLLLPPMDIQEKIKWTLESAAKGRIQILEAEASIDVLLPSILDRAFQGGL